MEIGTYTIRYLEAVVRKHIPHLSSEVKGLIKRAIEERLTKDPIRFGKPLRYSLQGHRRLRVGSYHIVYRIVPKEHVVLIVAIQHRKDIYDAL